jgi:hypothetical protein
VSKIDVRRDAVVGNEVVAAKTIDALSDVGNMDDSPSGMLD